MGTQVTLSPSSLEMKAKTNAYQEIYDIVQKPMIQSYPSRKTRHES